MFLYKTHEKTHKMGTLRTPGMLLNQYQEVLSIAVLTTMTNTD